MEQERNPQEGTNNVWKIAMGILCSGILAYGWRYSEVQNTGETLPSIVGYCLPSAFLIWIAVRLAILRGRGAKVAGICFLAIYGASIAGALLGVSQQKTEAKRAIIDIQNAWAALAKRSPDSHDMLRPRNGRVESTTRARGQVGHVERLLKDFIGEIVSQRDDYLLTLAAIGWDKILDTDRIARDKTLMESRKIVQRAREAVEEHERMTATLLANTRQRIQTLAMSNRLPQEALSSFDRGIQAAKPQIDALWILEKEVISQVANIFDLLSYRPRGWVISDGQILFYAENDLRRFNSYITIIQNLAAQQEELQKRNALAASRNFDSMKQMLK